MAAIHIVGFATALVFLFVLESTAEPGHHHIHTKHIIHTPLHIKMIHHHKIIKVPVVFRKHHHHHKHLSQEHVYIPLKEKPKPVFEDGAGDGFDEGSYPVKVIKVIKPEVYHSGGDSGEGINESNEHYVSQFGGDHNGHDYKADRSEDYNSYEYDESQENLKNQYYGRN